MTYNFKSNILSKVEDMLHLLQGVKSVPSTAIDALLTANIHQLGNVWECILPFDEDACRSPVLYAH